MITLHRARTGTASAAADAERIDPAVWRLAFTVIVGALAVVFDTTVVTVTLGDLAHGLGAPLSTIQRVSTGCLLAVSVTIPLACRAQSRLGGKPLCLLLPGRPEPPSSAEMTEPESAVQA